MASAPPTGSSRIDVPYCWPETLARPERPSKVTYLDLNHWISLAKANSGYPDGSQYRAILETLEAASAHGDAAFPLSDSLWIEIAKIRSHRQRRDLREVIERLSRYLVVTSRTVVTMHEIESMLDAACRPNPDPINLMPYLDWGVARAFGKMGGFRIKNATGEDITEWTRAGWKDGPAAFDGLLAAAELELQRATLDGPEPDQEDRMRQLGWNPRAAIEVAEKRAEQEINQVARFDADPSWRRGRLRDVVAAREIAIEILDPLSEGLARRHATLEGLFPAPEDARAAFDSMPSFDVAASLKTSLHRDPHHRWRPNHIHDIDALGSTLPYCDIVVTDTEMADHVRRSDLPERLGTAILSQLNDLAELLQ